MLHRHSKDKKQNTHSSGHKRNDRYTWMKNDIENNCVKISKKQKKNHLHPFPSSSKFFVSLLFRIKFRNEEEKNQKEGRDTRKQKNASQSRTISIDFSSSVSMHRDMQRKSVVHPPSKK